MNLNDTPSAGQLTAADLDHHTNTGRVFVGEYDAPTAAEYWRSEWQQEREQSSEFDGDASPIAMAVFWWCCTVLLAVAAVGAIAGAFGALG